MSRGFKGGFVNFKTVEINVKSGKYSAGINGVSSSREMCFKYACCALSFGEFSEVEKKRHQLHSVGCSIVQRSVGRKVLCHE